MDHRVVQPAIVDEQRTQRCVVRQLDDAIMAVRQHQFAFRTQHSVGFDPTDHPRLQIDARSRHKRPHRREHPHQPSARVRRAAHDLHLFHRRARPAGISRHPAQAQTVGIGMRRRLDHTGDAKGPQRIGGVFNALHFQPQISQGVEDVIQRRLGLKMVAEPGEGEFHRESPWSSVPDGVSPKGRR